MTRLSWRDPDPSPARPVTPVELFFDLVFVFTLMIAAIADVARKAARRVGADRYELRPAD